MGKEEKDRTAEAVQYLESLRSPIEAVTQHVWVGDEAVDYLINSKIALASSEQIQVNCNIEYPQHTNIRSVDLVAILGNLLDNALESCEKIPLQQRFLRIYMAVKGSQFYVSIQNSAKEEPDFEEKNYITKKRGNHGLGMKRMKAVVDKYDGYLTLASEPGIFAAGVTLSP